MQEGSGKMTEMTENLRLEMLFQVLDSIVLWSHLCSSKSCLDAFLLSVLVLSFKIPTLTGRCRAPTFLSLSSLYFEFSKSFN